MMDLKDKAFKTHREWSEAGRRHGATVLVVPLEDAEKAVEEARRNRIAPQAYLDLEIRIQEIERQLECMRTPASVSSTDLIAEARRHPEYGNALRACNLLASLADALERSERRLGELQREREAQAQSQKEDARG